MSSVPRTDPALLHDDERIVGAWSAAAARRFVTWLLSGVVGLLVVVFAFNAVVDPYGTLGTGLFPTVTPQDSSAKVQLLEALKQPPQVVVLGSSRAMRIEPSYIAQKTGLRSFNAAVRSGTPLDAWAFANFIHDYFRGAPPRYLWMLDINAFQYQSPAIHDNLFHTPQLSRYFPTADRNSLSLSDLWTMLSWQTTRDSLRSVRADIRGLPPVVKRDRRAPGEFTPDGGRAIGDFGDPNVGSGAGLDVRIKATAKEAEAEFAKPAFSAEPRRYFERTLAAMNSWGIQPVFVLTPIHPTLHKLIGPLGWDKRHQKVLGYLASLHSKYRFTVIDMTSTATFGGTPDGFYDGSHMKVANLRLMLDAVIARDPGLD
jgi:hypothetical protein